MQDPFADLHTIIKNPRRTGGVKKVDDSVQPQTTIVPQPTVVVQPSTIEPSIPTTSVTQITTSSTTNTPTKKKYTDDYDPFSNISALAGIKKKTKEPTPETQYALFVMFCCFPSYCCCFLCVFLFCFWLFVLGCLGFVVVFVFCFLDVSDVFDVFLDVFDVVDVFSFLSDVFF